MSHASITLIQVKPADAIVAFAWLKFINRQFFATPCKPFMATYIKQSFSAKKNTKKPHPFCVNKIQVRINFTCYKCVLVKKKCASVLIPSSQ